MKIKKCSRPFITTVITTVLSMLMLTSVSASPMGFDSKYMQGLTSSSRDSNVYIPQSITPVTILPATKNDVYLFSGSLESLAPGADTTDYLKDHTGLSLSENGQRMSESLYFKNGTTIPSVEYVSKLMGEGSALVPEIKTQFNGKYVEFQVKDFSKGVNLSKVFVSGDGSELNLLELNKGLHGYEIAYIQNPETSKYEYCIIPKSVRPGNIELLLNDTLLIVLKPSNNSDVSPMKFTSMVDVKFSSLQAIVLEDVPAQPDTTVEETVGTTTMAPEESLDDYLAGYGSSTSNEFEDNTEVTEPSPEPKPEDNTGDFFKDAGVTNVFEGDTGTWNSSISSNPFESPKSSGGYVQTSEPVVKKVLDTSKIDLDPMTWGVSLRDGSTYGEISIDGDNLLADWSDTMDINITSLSSGNHEFVQRKAVYPKKITPIVATVSKPIKAGMLLPLSLFALAIGTTIIYMIFINAYVLKVRKRIKMSEIESLKSNNVSSIGDLDSFEIG